MTTKPQRGGARPGAGRKPKGELKQSAQIRLLFTPAEMAQIRERWGAQPGREIRAMVLEALSSDCA